MAPRKRNHKTLTHKEKSNILDDLKQGISGKSLAVKYGVGTSTISDIKKNSDIMKR
jgi:IS30 family transposase